MGWYTRTNRVAPKVAGAAWDDAADDAEWQRGSRVLQRFPRWAERHVLIVDAIWTVVLGVPGVLLSALLLPPTVVTGIPQGRSGDLPVLAWATAVILPLVVRRRYPIVSTAAVAAAAAGHVLIGGVPVIVPADIAILVALWSITVYGPVWAHRAALGVAILGAGLLGFAILVKLGTDFSTVNMAVILGVVGATLALMVWALALVRRSRKETLDALRDRARRLEIERDQQAAIATAAERSRIAREMHDIVAHSLSVVVAQADGGRYAATTDPAAATRALQVIADTGRDALADMRRLIGVLREDSVAPRMPQPGTAAIPTVNPVVSPDIQPAPGEVDDADLGALIDQTRAAGMAVSYVRVGEARRLPPGAGLTMHRICQEALTNVRKHAGPAVHVMVAVGWWPGSVELDIADDGRGAAADLLTADDATAGGHTAGGQPGYGIVGMQERAAIFGGQVTAGPKPGGGWRVRFVMPLPTHGATTHGATTHGATTHGREESA
jgi:signal transduction histidine kinase